MKELSASHGNGKNQSRKKKTEKKGYMTFVDSVKTKMNLVTCTRILDDARFQVPRFAKTSVRISNVSVISVRERDGKM